jgi:hypothetical protein
LVTQFIKAGGSVKLQYQKHRQLAFLADGIKYFFRSNEKHGLSYHLAAVKITSDMSMASS